MKGRFADVLRGLMNHRRLTPEAVAQASGRAGSTIGITEDISPVPEMPVADLRVIAGLPDAPAPGRSAPYRVATEIGELVAVASRLTLEQLAPAHLVAIARDHRSATAD
ncbi:XRE family transcriptional regulator [Streptomyces sp. NPDC008238]